MREINIETWQRKKTFDWFRGFSNATYSCNVLMDVTKLVQHTKNQHESFFANLLFIVMQGLNSVPEMRMRLVDNKVILYDDINPAFTVMTKSGCFENVKMKNNNNYSEFYREARRVIDEAKEEDELRKTSYNTENCFDEYYITCVPWIDVAAVTHPMPDDISNQCIPRVCFGKYTEKDNRYVMMLNINVNHILVDGYPLSQAFNKIQELLDKADEILK